MTEYSSELAQSYAKQREKLYDTDSIMIEAILKAGIKNKDILDLGCGNGFYLEKLLSLGAKSTSGIDISPAQVHIAQERIEKLEGKAQVTQGDIAKLPYPDESFDVICSHFVLQHIPNVSPPIAEAFRVLRKGGVFISLFNTIKTTNQELHNKELPILLQAGDTEVTVIDLVKFDDEFQDAIKNTKLQLLSYLPCETKDTSIHPETTFLDEVEELQQILCICQKQ